MKLLHVIAGTDPESGGPIEALLRISEVLLRDGHEVALVSLEDQRDIANRKFPFPATGIGRGAFSYRYNPRLTPWLRENARYFDTVVLHGLWNYSSFGSWRALRKSGIPYYIFSHGMMDVWFRDRYPVKHFAKQAFWSLAEGRVLRDANAVLFTCEEERNRSRDIFKGHAYRERVVLFGTADPPGEAPSQVKAFYSAFPHLQGRRFILFLSRIHPKKGCDLLVQAFANVAHELPGDLDIVIAGPDQVGWVPQLRALARSLGIDRRIHWPGMLKNDVKWGAFRAAEAMMLPSHQENFGFVVAESMACSTPVLISDKVAVWREVQASRAGLVEPDTLEGTANLFRRFLALSTDERTAMARDARTAFLKYFDIQVAARDFARAIGFEARVASSSRNSK